MTARVRVIAAAFACWSQLLRAQAPASQAPTAIEPVRPVNSFWTRPYSPASIPPTRLSNTDRLRGMIQAGKLYLSVHDAIELALENNIDVEIARYRPLTLEWNLERSQAGGALPGVPSGASQASSVTSGQGVLGSQSAAGVGGGGGSSGGGGNAGNGSVSQIGPVTQNLDPSIQEASTFSHRTSLQANSTQSLTSALVDNSRAHSATFQDGLLSGGSFSLTFKDSYLRENAATNILNPSVAQSLGLSIQHNLLRGRGIAVNARSIEVAKNNLAMSDLDFRTTISQTIASVLNAYWTLAENYEDLKAKEDAFDTAQKFVDENKRRVDLGALAPIDLVDSRNQLATAALDRVNSRTALMRTEIQLKNLISRTGASDPVLEGVTIVPTGTISIPDSDETLNVKDLVAKALANRSDLKSDEANLRNSEISSLGTKNGLLPQAQAFAQLSNSGLAGQGHAVNGQSPNAFLVGGAGTALRQVLGRDYPSESIGAFGSFTLGNRQAQADYGIDQLQYRQTQLTTSETRNQVGVDITNSVIALRQARARYEAAHANLQLQKELLEGEQQKFALGESTSFNVIRQQRDLAAARSSELSALVTWQSARINLDAITGTIIESNSVTLAQAKSGEVR